MNKSSAQSTRRRLLRGAALLAVLPAAAARSQPTASAGTAAKTARSTPGADTPLARIDDLRLLLEAVARERRPLLLFFSTPGCPYCREVRRSYLRPRAEEGEAASGVMIREVEVTSGRPLRDASGSTVTEAAFAGRHAVKMVPHLELVDSRGERLVKPLIGLDSSGFYESYLQNAIADATAKLAR